MEAFVVVLLMVMLNSRADSHTFTGGTERGSFTCHCLSDVQCDDDTGACPGDVCAVSGSFAWGNIACQHGNVALSGGTADQTDDSGHVAGRCIDGDTNNVITHGSCCNPGRSNGELSWSIEFEGTYAIKDVTIYTAADGNDRNSIRGVQVYVSASRTPTDAELCGVQSESFQGSTTVRCATMIGRYVIIRQPDVNMVEMIFCEVQVEGYQYHSCGYYDGDYRYGPGCVQNCHCDHQCDVITGDCDGDCTSGWRKVNGACALTCSSGFWGVNCESNCHCASHNRACKGVTGACDDDCDSGYSGFNCQTECDDRHWGSNCVHECHCDCDSITGECDGPCDPGYYGDRCHHECGDGTWGIGNESGCLINCYCTVPCDKVDGRCDGPCVAGRHGSSCQHVCADGAWGEDCLNTCNCYAGEFCEKTDGSCDRCPDWFVGVSCDQELPRMTDITPVHSVGNDNVTVRFPAPHNTDYYTVEYKTDGDWMMDATRYPHNTQQNQQMIHITVEYNIEYEFRIVPWKDDIDQPGEPSQVFNVYASCDLAPGWWGSGCEHPCRCLDASEVCNVTNGYCESGCDVRYIGEGCNIVKPTLRNSNITFTEDNDLIIITITDIEYMTEIVREYLVQYKLLHGNSSISIRVNPTSGRKRREVGENDVVLQISFSDQSINSQYEFEVVPLISAPEYNGVVGVPSESIQFNSGCLQYTGLPSCNQWCVCSNDPGTLCLLTCEYCYICDSEPKLPSGENVNFEITDITTNSMTIRFMDSDPDLPDILTFTTRLGDVYSNISSDADNADHTFEGLTSNTAYDIEVTAVLEGGIVSKPWTISASTLNASSSDKTLYIIIGCVCFVILVTVIIIVIIVITIVKRRRKPAVRATKEAKLVTSTNGLHSITDDRSYSNNGKIQSIINEVKSDYAVPIRQRKPTVGKVINYKDLHSHCTEQNIDALREEFCTIPATTGAPTTMADHKSNVEKNRFKNIKPYDHSRVELSQIGGDRSTTYINASYIHGYNIDQEFIASQAPRVCTLNDMWRMIWQKDINLIVMLTGLKEGSKTKSQKYWPTDEKASYGDVTVEITSTSVFAFYTERHLLATLGDSTRHIHHLQFTSWPDHDAPQVSSEFLEFYTKVYSLSGERTGPLLVHCSAGVGRTGTFIAIDYLLKQGKTEEVVDVLGCVTDMRSARMEMVQHTEQYRFVYMTLNEAFGINSLVSSPADFPDQLINLKASTAIHRSQLSLQYEQLNRLFPLCTDADAIPADAVHDITVVSDKDNFVYLEQPCNRSSFINAVYSNSYMAPKAFIMTQVPLDDAKADFWRLVVERDVVGIILLHDVEAEQCYWPQEQNRPTLYADDVTVTMTNQTRHPDHVQRDFDLQYTDNGENIVRTLRQWHVNDVASVSDLEHQLVAVQQVRELMTRYNSTHSGPVIVQCVDGVSVSCMVVGLYCIIEKIKATRQVDVLFAVKQLRNVRRNALHNQEHFVLLYDLVCAVVRQDEESEYCNTAQLM